MALAVVGMGMMGMWMSNSRAAKAGWVAPDGEGGAREEVL
jgi:hypothetical protein